MLFLSIRQIGILLARSGPVGARHSDGVGPRIGENIRPFVEPLFNDAAMQGRPGLYVFLSNACAVCTIVEQAAVRLGTHWHDRANIFLIYDGGPEDVDVGYRAVGRGAFLLRHPDIRERLGVNSVPHAVVINAAGVVLGQGLVNASSHLESLLELTYPEAKADGSGNGNGRLPPVPDGEMQRRRKSTWSRVRTKI